MKIQIKSLLVFLVFCLAAATSHAQGLTQTIRGTIIDLDSKQPAIGANVVIVNSNPLQGTSTDIDGNFRLENVPVGRVTLKITCLTYEDRVLANVLVGSGKEVVLNIELQESMTQLETFEVTGGAHKADVLNEMATVSARKFSVEETSRYAGSFNDPARMVGGFAGVNNDPSGNNDIVVRGNSPKGIQWRLEGVEIPNPNHFSDEGSTGGPINALNGDVLANSDFYAGAFAPEFGNAYSGLFDIRLRKGNNEKREYSFGVGVLGTDFTLEGPFKAGGKSSYLVNYRYSSLAILDQANIVDFDGVPKYQDAAFKLHLPTKNAGVFSVFGFGGKSSIFETEFDEFDAEKLISTDDYKSDVAVVGVNNTYSLGKKTYVKTTVSGSQNSSGIESETRNNLGDFYTDDTGGLRKYSTRFATTLNHKFNARNKVRTGMIYSHHFYDLDLSYFDEELNRRVTEVQQKGDAGVVQGFFSWQFRATENLSFTSGLHYLQFTLNQADALEPRLGLRWNLNDKNTLTAGFGQHSKVESITNYFAESTRADGTSYQPNIDLDLYKARHYVLGFEHRFNANLFGKTEVYYQTLYNVPVHNDVTSNFSLLNSSDFFTDVPLVNAGTGTNYGLEFTLERFFNQGFFFTTTASLYDSKYKALDGVERNTKFNGNYTGNLIGGKEFAVGKPEKNRTLSVNGRVSLIGGNRYTPIDLEASRAAGHTVRDYDRAFEARGENVLLVNFAISMRRERPKSTRELKLDIQNLTNHQATTFRYYNSDLDQIVESHQLPILPTLLYRVSF